MTGEELRVALTSIRSRYTFMQEQIEGESNMDFVDRMIYESEEYLMTNVINLFNEMDEEEVDWGQLKREELAVALRADYWAKGEYSGFTPPTDDPPSGAWLAVADKAIEILLGEGGE